MSNKDKSPPHSGLSRRGFFRTVSATGVAGGLIGAPKAPDAAAEEHAGQAGAVGPGETQITLNINGKPHTLKVEPRVTLLDALRNRLDLTGSKKVCDRATCGACTVMVDDYPAYACTMLAVEAQGRKIRSIESLGTAEDMHPVQEAFVEHDAQQCGFCTPGFVMACSALLEKNPNPTDAEIEKALGGNLCRCGTYAGMKQAVRDAAETMKGGA